MRTQSRPDRSCTPLAPTLRTPFRSCRTHEPLGTDAFRPCCGHRQHGASLCHAGLAVHARCAPGRARMLAGWMRHAEHCHTLFREARDLRGFLCRRHSHGHGPDDRRGIAATVPRPAASAVAARRRLLVRADRRGRRGCLGTSLRAGRVRGARGACRRPQRDRASRLPGGTRRSVLGRPGWNDPGPGAADRRFRASRIGRPRPDVFNRPSRRPARSSAGDPDHHRLARVAIGGQQAQGRMDEPGGRGPWRRGGEYLGLRGRDVGVGRRSGPGRRQIRRARGADAPATDPLGGLARRRAAARGRPTTNARSQAPPRTRVRPSRPRPAG